MFKTGDRVTYAKTRDTQSVEPERRDATGTIADLLEIIGGHPCARVCWEWAPEVGYWVRHAHLEILPRNR